MSRIVYNGKLYDYPLKAMNALRNLGPWQAFLCILSYAWVRIRPPKDQSKFEGWVAARFSWRLYRIFFKTYSEKVWGVPCTELEADWAAQRIKNLSLFTAIKNAVMPKRNQKDVTSLIEEFQYPKYGPGMMWETAADKVQAHADMLPPLADDAPEADLRAWCMAELRATSPWSLPVVMAELGRFDATGWIGGVDVPAGVLVTAKDRAIPTERQWQLAGRIPDAITRVAPGGHASLVFDLPHWKPVFLELVDAVVERTRQSVPSS